MMRRIWTFIASLLAELADHRAARHVRRAAGICTCCGDASAVAGLGECGSCHAELQW
jgi:hypothetical protein